jgi:hypothetical protein
MAPTFTDDDGAGGVLDVGVVLDIEVVGAGVIALIGTVILDITLTLKGVRTHSNLLMSLLSPA